MSEPMDERDLDRTLSTIGRDLAYPTRDLWPEVRARIVARGRAPWWSRLPLGPSPLPVAATLLVLIVVLVALTPSAVAFAERVLGVPGIQIFPVPETPSTRPSATATPALFTGTRVSSLAQATQAAGFAVQAPTGLGEPDAIYVDRAPARVTLVYTSRPGIPQSPAVGVSAVVVEFRGSFDQNVMGKAVGPGTTLESVAVNGTPGFWLEGAPHQVFYRDPAGSFVQETLRLAENTLLWESEGITYRLEAQVAKAEALRLAGTFR